MKTYVRLQNFLVVLISSSSCIRINVLGTKRLFHLLQRRVISAYLSGCMSIIAHAMQHGHLEVLKWLHAKRLFAWNPARILHCAAFCGHLNIIKWLHEIKFIRLGAVTCAMAASVGQNCPWDERTTATALENGHVELFEWARLNGCPHHGN
jgi:hypothetical protein